MIEKQVNIDVLSWGKSSQNRHKGFIQKSGYFNPKNIRKDKPLKNPRKLAFEENNVETGLIQPNGKGQSP